ncbi:MAG: hypothetical protein JXN64_13365 [Spirochaetes bacterium]|nr:hypothetical protein [Spirochaetota bacterium]
MHDDRAAMMQIMYDYAGNVGAGPAHLRRIKKKTYSEINAANQHELMHYLEVLNSYE